jgi:predicted Na+-dependent transporter
LPLIVWIAVMPWIVIGLLLLPIVAHGGFVTPEGFPDEPIWAQWAHAIVFLVWGLTLSVATFAYRRAIRRSVSGEPG